MSTELAGNALTTAARVADAFTLSAVTARIERVINAVSQAFESQCGRKFGKATVSTTAPEFYQGNGTTELYLRRYPIISVERVRIAESVVTDYRRSADWDERGKLIRDSRWPLFSSSWQDLPMGARRSPACEVEHTIDVAYVGGYVLPKDATTQAPCTLPADLEEACIREVVRAIMRPMPTLLKEQTPGQWRQEWADPGEFDSITRGVLLRYTRLIL